MVLAIVSFGLMARAANIGGDIRHVELANTVAPHPGFVRAIASFVLANTWVWPSSETLHFIGLSLLIAMLSLAGDSSEYRRSIYVLGRVSAAPVSVSEALAWLAHDLGDPLAAEAWAIDAFEHADQADDHHETGHREQRLFRRADDLPHLLQCGPRQDGCEWLRCVFVHEPLHGQCRVARL